MSNIKIFKDLIINMLEDLIKEANSGKKVDLKLNPSREIVRLVREGQEVDTVILSMEYSGEVDGKAFELKKDYSFAEDMTQYALESLLISNNRLQMDYDRLKEAGIDFKGEFFNFQNAFVGLPGDASLRAPALRLQSFIHLSRAGGQVSVEVKPKCSDIHFKRGEKAERGFVCMGSFVFTTEKEKTLIEKLYGIGSYEDTNEFQKEVKEMANKRLERDCARLRNVGIQVGGQVSF